MSERAGPEAPDTADEPNAHWSRIRLLAVRSVVVVLLAALVMMVLKLHPQTVPLKRDPGFIDVIFASRAVIAAVRTLIIFGSAYVALSVLALIWNQHWLTGFAGAQTGRIERSVSGLDEERDRLAAQLAASEETIRTLEDRLAATLRELEDTAMAPRHGASGKA